MPCCTMFDPSVLEMNDRFSGGVLATPSDSVGKGGNGCPKSETSLDNVKSTIESSIITEDTLLSGTNISRKYWGGAMLNTVHHLLVLLSLRGAGADPDNVLLQTWHYLPPQAFDHTTTTQGTPAGNPGVTTQRGAATLNECDCAYAVH